MKYLVLTLGLVVMVVNGSVMAQTTTSPIFVSPYQQNIKTYDSPVPSVVTRKVEKKARSYSKRQENSWETYSMSNPLEGTSFGRLTREIDYYDAETGQYFNQYDYMGLLVQRGDLEKLNEVASYLQTTGVFSPQKYQAALQAAKNGSSLSAEMASNGGKVTGGDSARAQQQQLFIVKPQNSVTTPQKIHEGYDRDSSAASNKPIFIE